jgi:hypothetical protein
LHVEVHPQFGRFPRVSPPEEVEIEDSIVFVEGYDQIRLGDAVALEQIDAREYPQSGFSGRGAEAREDEDICTERGRGGRSEEK